MTIFYCGNSQLSLQAIANTWKIHNFHSNSFRVVTALRVTLQIDMAEAKMVFVCEPFPWPTGDCPMHHIWFHTCRRGACNNVPHLDWALDKIFSILAEAFQWNLVWAKNHQIFNEVFCHLSGLPNDTLEMICAPSVAPTFWSCKQCFWKCFILHTHHCFACKWCQQKCLNWHCSPNNFQNMHSGLSECETFFCNLSDFWFHFQLWLLVTSFDKAKETLVWKSNSIFACQFC